MFTTCLRIFRLWSPRQCSWSFILPMMCSHFSSTAFRFASACFQNPPACVSSTAHHFPNSHKNLTCFVLIFSHKWQKQKRPRSFLLVPCTQPPTFPVPLLIGSNLCIDCIVSHTRSNSRSAALYWLNSILFNAHFDCAAPSILPSSVFLSMSTRFSASPHSDMFQQVFAIRASMRF